MAKSFKRYARESINSILGLVGVEVVARHSWSEPRTFIPFRQTLAGAQKASLSVSDYIDLKHNVPGATQETIDRIADLGVFDGQIERVCEIGPGSGRYLEKTLRACNPSYYEIYETATEWANWLVQTYHVHLQPTNGLTLSSTPSHSIDLVQAHKVFGVMPFLPTIAYFLEMVRVVREGGHIVFDVMTELSMADAILEKWLAAGMPYSSYPAVMPEAFTLNFFCSRGFDLNGQFHIPNRPGITKYFVFRKRQAQLL